MAVTATSIASTVAPSAARQAAAHARVPLDTRAAAVLPTLTSVHPRRARTVLIVLMVSMLSAALV